MRVAYIGNFEPEHSTENHVARALRNNGHVVEQFQEHKVEEWERLVRALDGVQSNISMVLWTRTIWNPPISYTTMRRMQMVAKDRRIPTVSYHLDRWWGLNREQEVKESPFFRNDIVITADGGHEADFKAQGINHVWMPPGVSRDECLRVPQPRSTYMHDVVFCGSSHHYHSEWHYRLRLVTWLQQTFGSRLGLYPQDQPALRGQDLVDLYGNAKVMVGDSCLNGNAHHYWSDRIPETLGRGGFLIHPYVEGIEDHFTDGEHLVLYPLEDFGRLHELIEYFVARDDLRQQIATKGKDHVLAYHTYERRMEQVVDLVMGS